MSQSTGDAALDVLAEMARAGPATPLIPPPSRRLCVRHQRMADEPTTAKLQKVSAANRVCTSDLAVKAAAWIASVENMRRSHGVGPSVAYVTMDGLNRCGGAGHRPRFIRRCKIDRIQFEAARRFPRSVAIEVILHTPCNVVATDRVLLTYMDTLL